MLHGGPEGVLDLGLLEFALARPRNPFEYSEQDVSLEGLRPLTQRELSPIIPL